MRSRSPGLLARLAGGALALVTPFLALAAFAVLFLLVIGPLKSPAAALGLGGLAFFGVALGLFWLAFSLFRPRRPLRAAAGVALLASAGLALLVWFGVLRPFPSAPNAPAPAGVRFWTVPDGRLAYVFSPAAVPGSARPPVIFLHGGPGTPGEGLPALAPELNRMGFDVYAYDQIGAGRSTRLPDVAGYTVARNVADLERVRRAVGADRMILVGTSWGATLAAHYAAKFPDRVDRVIFVSPGALWPPARGGDGAEPFETLRGERRARYLELTEDPRFLLQMLLLDVSPAAAKRFVGDREADARFHAIGLTGSQLGRCRPSSDETAVHGNALGFYANILTNRDLKTTADPRPALRRASTPALILRGECDYIARAYAQDYEGAFARSRLVDIPGSGHSIRNEQPQAYARLVGDFLAGR
jgi:pimeloyl-ACP methyl ester carboxylesterase